MAYKLFRSALEQLPWNVGEILSRKPGERDDRRAELGWRLASRSYYAEQAGLVTAAALAAETDDVAYRFDMAAAAADEARHADAFLRYAEHVGGSAENCVDEISPLDDQLTSLPYLGKALAHTVLEGFAADEFLLLKRYFRDDGLSEIYHYVRRDETRHVAVGVSYLARALRDERVREEYREHSREWLEVCRRYADVEDLADMIAGLTGQNPAVLARWFRTRHRNRMSAMNLVVGGG
ncbi:hypothetical protein [Saccharothrix sp. Mg75]|uniref:hypothetical protein n=1 Tax=Saccharothrix sp. Mg75 TaxID=3445357 RepID=UPI003EEC5403